jgi:hypothetical protein
MTIVMPVPIELMSGTNPQAGQVIQQAATALAAKAASKALGPGQTAADQDAAELANLKRALDPAKK